MVHIKQAVDPVLLAMIPHHYDEIACRAPALCFEQPSAEIRSP